MIEEEGAGFTRAEQPVEWSATRCGRDVPQIGDRHKLCNLKRGDDGAEEAGEAKGVVGVHVEIVTKNECGKGLWKLLQKMSAGRGCGNTLKLLQKTSAGRGCGTHIRKCTKPFMSMPVGEGEREAKDGLGVKSAGKWGVKGAYRCARCWDSS